MGLTLTELFGRFHPLLVHFPIAFFLAAAGLEIWRLWKDSREAAAMVRWLCVLGAVGALGALATGWIFAGEVHRSDKAVLLAQHRWLGVSATVLAIASAVLVHVFGESARASRRWWARACVWTTAVLIAVGAHFGAMLVWGKDYFFE